jgi:uncharacterized protein (TIGR02246 family)
VISQQEASAWIAAYGKAWTTQDVEGVARLFTEDATYRERHFRPALEGRDAIRDYWQLMVHDLQHDIGFEVHQVVVAGEQAFAHWTAHFAWRPINGVLELDAFCRLTFAAESEGGLRLCSTFEEWIDSREA